MLAPKGKGNDIKAYNNLILMNVIQFDGEHETQTKQCETQMVITVNVHDTYVKGGHS